MLLRTLGGLGLSGVPFRRHRPLLLLAYLALEGPKERTYLAELFWPTAANPRQSLTVALSQLRGAAPAVVAAEGTRIRADVECDAARLLDAAAEREWRQVVDAYQGPFLSGVEVGTGIELEEWLYETREMLATCAQRGMMEVAERHMAAGDASAAARLTQRAIVLRADANAADERLLARLHALAAATHNPGAARLERELTEFGPAPDGSAGAVDRGRTTATSHNLPRPATPFLGRDRELNALEHALEGGARLVTLTGIGGMGKTRLALRFAERVVDAGAFDQVVFVPLETAHHGEAALAQVAAAVGAGDDAEPTAALRERLGSSRVLLVLDTFEHLTAAAPLLADLQEACPGTTLLVTSRHSLGLPGEHVLPIDGLALPDRAADALPDPSAFAGMQLYLLTARRSDPHLTLTEANAGAVLRTCALLGGAPLGIELAAALARAVPAEELAQELEADLDMLAGAAVVMPAKHASLRTAFERSWQLLGAAEQAALAACSVFSGSFRWAAAQDVMRLDLALLASLVDKSLLVHREGRYHLHALVRQYAAEKLAGLKEALDVPQRHAEHYAAWLRSKAGAMLGPDEGAALEAVRADYPNVRAAWTWAAAAGREDLIGAMLAVLSAHLITSRRLAELADLATAALANIDPSSPLAARLLHAQAKQYVLTGDGRARALVERALAIRRAHGDQTATMHSLYDLGEVHLNARDWPAAREVLQEVLDFLRAGEEEDPHTGGCLNNLAIATQGADEYLGLLMDAADACRSAGNRVFLANVMANIADALQVTHGDYAGALDWLRRALEVEGSGSKRAYALAGMHRAAARCLVQLGDLDGAERELAAGSLRLREGSSGADDALGAYSAGEGVAVLVSLASGDTVAARTLAAKLPREQEAAVIMAWVAFQEADALGLQRHRRGYVASYEADATGTTARGDVLTRATARLMSAALAALPGSQRPASGATTGAGALRGPAMRGAALGPATLGGAVHDLTLALADITACTFVPLALHAFVVAGVAAPFAVDDELLGLSAWHPAAHVQTRRHALELLRHASAAVVAASAGSDSDVGATDLGTVPPPVLALAAQVPTERIMELAAGLQERLLPLTAAARVDAHPLGGAPRPPEDLAPS